LTKTIDLTDFFSASERSDIGLMSELCYVFLSLMWRTLHLPNRKNSSNAKGFLWRTRKSPCLAQIRTQYQFL